MQTKEEVLDKDQQNAGQQVEAQQADRPTVEMQGVSGKTIAATVKVFKAKRPRKEATPAVPQAEAQSATLDPNLAQKSAEPVAEATAQISSAVSKTADTGLAKKPERPAGPEQTTAVAESPTQEQKVKQPPEQRRSSAEDSKAAAVSKQESRKPAVKSQEGAEPVSVNKDDKQGKASKSAAEAGKTAVEERPTETKPLEQLVHSGSVSGISSIQPRKIGNIHKQRQEAEAAAQAEAEAKRIEQATSAGQADPAGAAEPPKPAAPKGPRKLGNIFQQMNAGRQGGKPVDSGLAATARAFARQHEQRGQGAERRRQGPGAQSFGPGRRTSNTGVYHAGGPGAGGFDKDREDDRQNRNRRPALRRKPGGTPMFEAPLPSSSGRGFAQRSAMDRNKKREHEGRDQNQRRRGNLKNFNYDQDEMYLRRGGKRQKRGQKQVAASQLTHISLPASITVKEFAEAIQKTSAEVIKVLMLSGVMASLNEVIDYDTASLVAEEFGIQTEQLVEVSEEDILFDESEDLEEDLQPRAPVVAVMGHVDHGKTSLLDYIRNSRVASGEAGGITQHIGAYTVDVRDRQITFLDTPGHEAFTTMRMRGAQATDIAILVVAADDGVMPQTIEAINHAKAAETTIVVAINKMDKAGANVDRVKQELAAHEVLAEDWGGSTVMVPVSAKTGEGVDELLDMLLLTADMLELKANPNRQAKGIVIEAKLDKNRGAVATVLVQRGTLHRGETLVTGAIVGNVRAMANASGRQVKEAGPSMPVEILGLPEVPEAGEVFYAVEDERVARQLADKRRAQQRETLMKSSSRMNLDTLYSRISAGEVKDLNIVVKADVVGSAEAVKQSLEKLSNEKVRIQVIHSAVGAINESDIRLAEVSNAVVIGFNVRPVNNAGEIAKEAGVDVRLYRVIYNAIEDMEAAMQGLLDPVFREQVNGHAEIREIFRVSSVGTIGGAYVTDGTIQRNSQVRLIRDGVVITEGKLASLRRFKDDVREVHAGYECGLSLERFNDIKAGDVIEAFEMKEVAANAAN